MIISNFKIFYDNLKKLSYNSNFASKCTVSCSVTRNAVKGGHRDAKNQKKKFFFFGALRNVYVKGHPYGEEAFFGSWVNIPYNIVDFRSMGFQEKLIVDRKNFRR